MLFPPPHFLGVLSKRGISQSKMTCKMNMTWIWLSVGQARKRVEPPGSALQPVGRWPQFVFTSCALICTHLPLLAPLAQRCPHLMPSPPAAQSYVCIQLPSSIKLQCPVSLPWLGPRDLPDVIIGESVH